MCIRDRKEPYLISNTEDENHLTDWSDKLQQFFQCTTCLLYTSIKMIHYYGIILVFALGAGLGGVASRYIGISAIWSCAVLLTIGFILMFKEKI